MTTSSVNEEIKNITNLNDGDDSYSYSDST
jgi:hypothetical protein